MKPVVARFRDGVDGRGRVKAILCRHCAGLNLEFLESVRKWQRQAQTVVGILPDGTIQQIRHAVAVAARHRYHDRGIVSYRIHRTLSGIVRHAGQEDQFVRIASVERHLRDLLIRDDLPDGRSTRFNQSGVRCNFNLLRGLADLKHDVDQRAGIDLKDNTSLQVGPEAGQSGFEHIRSDGQTGEDIVACLIRDGRPLAAGRGLSNCDLDAG